MTLLLLLLFIVTMAVIIFKMISALFSQTEAGARSYMRLYMTILWIKLSMIGLVVFTLLIAMFWFRMSMRSINLPFLSQEPDDTEVTIRPTQANLAMPGAGPVKKEEPEMVQKKKIYRAGDLYEYAGNLYTLVDKSEYRLRNLDHYPTVELNGKTFILVIKAS